MNTNASNSPNNFDPPRKRNRTSMRNRSLCLSCLDRVKLIEYKQKLNDLKEEKRRLSTSSSSSKNDTEISSFELQINQLLSKGDNTQIYKRKSEIQMLSTVKSAQENLGDRFETLIGFTAKDIDEISSAIYYSQGKRDFVVKNQKGKRRVVILFEELFMTIAIRHRYSLRTLAAISMISGRDESIISLMIRSGMKYLLQRFGWTLDLSYALRYRDCVKQWNQAIAMEYEEKEGCYWNELPVSIQHAALLLDGTRVKIRRPKDQDMEHRVYSGYTKSHNCLTLGVLAPNGLFIATTPLLMGSTNDAAATTIFNLPKYLERDLVAGCLCDSMFKFQYPMLSLRQELYELHIITKQQLKRLRSIRTSVEHGFSSIKGWFPYFNSGTIKLAENAPMLITKTAFLLFNIKTCLNGNLVTERFKLKPPTIYEYLDISN